MLVYFLQFLRTGETYLCFVFVSQIFKFLFYNQYSLFSSVQESESEDDDDGLDIGDDDDVEEPENEPEAVVKEPTIEKAAPVPVPSKDAERQLSKKELKKKEMAELDALLHELGIANKDSNAAQDETTGNPIFHIFSSFLYILNFNSHDMHMHMN